MSIERRWESRSKRGIIQGSIIIASYLDWHLSVIQSKIAKDAGVKDGEPLFCVFISTNSADPIMAYGNAQQVALKKAQRKLRKVWKEAHDRERFLFDALTQCDSVERETNELTGE